MTAPVDRPIRKKLPAYGAALLTARRTGEHPRCVHLIYGNNWRAELSCSWRAMPGEHPMVALKPEDYTPGAYDFAVLTGVHVAVFDQIGAAGQYREPDRANPSGSEWGLFYMLLGEVAQFAAQVEFQSPALKGVTKADVLAFCMRASSRRADAALNHGWPEWWSQDIEEKNERRRHLWLAAGIERELETFERA